MPGELFSASGNTIHKFELDEVLIQQIQQEVDGADIHQAANLIGAYKTSVYYYNQTGDSDMLKMACETTAKLRMLLLKNRLKATIHMICRH